jgi:cytochrome c oxidase assembly protein subunit 15
MLAIAIYVYMFWVALDLLRGRNSIRVKTGWVTAGFVLTGLVLLTITSGGFVAGLRAGFTYNTFPLMNGQWIPDGLLLLEPVWRNFTENITAVQFNHRVLAIFVAALVVAFWWAARRRTDVPVVRGALDLMLVAVAVQVGLGIATLLLVVPIPLAAAHQGGAVLLVTAVLNVAHVLKRPDAISPG